MEAEADTDHIQTVIAFRKEIESLEKLFQDMLNVLQDDMVEGEPPLQHILLLDHGVEQASVR